MGTGRGEEEQGEDRSKNDSYSESGSLGGVFGGRGLFLDIVPLDLRRI